MHRLPNLTKSQKPLQKSPKSAKKAPNVVKKHSKKSTTTTTTLTPIRNYSVKEYPLPHSILTRKVPSLQRAFKTTTPLRVKNLQPELVSLQEQQIQLLASILEKQTLQDEKVQKLTTLFEQTQANQSKISSQLDKIEKHLKSPEPVSLIPGVEQLEDSMKKTPQQWKTLEPHEKINQILTHLQTDIAQVSLEMTHLIRTLYPANSKSRWTSYSKDKQPSQASQWVSVIGADGSPVWKKREWIEKDAAKARFASISDSTEAVTPPHLIPGQELDNKQNQKAVSSFQEQHDGNNNVNQIDESKIKTKQTQISPNSVPNPQTIQISVDLDQIEDNLNLEKIKSPTFPPEVRSKPKQFHTNPKVIPNTAFEIPEIDLATQM